MLEIHNSARVRMNQSDPFIRSTQVQQSETFWSNVDLHIIYSLAEGKNVSYLKINAE